MRHSRAQQTNGDDGALHIEQALTCMTLRGESCDTLPSNVVQSLRIPHQHYLRYKMISRLSKITAYKEKITSACENFAS
jgi:hypothetical protein